MVKYPLVRAAFFAAHIYIFATAIGNEFPTEKLNLRKDESGRVVGAVESVEGYQLGDLVEILIEIDSDEVQKKTENYYYNTAGWGYDPDGLYVNPFPMWANPIPKSVTKMDGLN